MDPKGSRALDGEDEIKHKCLKEQKEYH